MDHLTESDSKAVQRPVDAKRFFTVVYQLAPGSDVQRVLDAGEWVAAGWCDAMAERDALEEAQRDQPK